MPEFSVGGQLLPQSPPSFQELRERIAAVRRSNAERQAASDQFFVDAVRTLTNIELNEAVESARRSEAIGSVVGVGESLIIDRLITSPTSSSAELPAGVDSQGRPRAINQKGQTAYAIDKDGNLVAVQMLPMWDADP